MSVTILSVGDRSCNRLASSRALSKCSGDPLSKSGCGKHDVI